MAKLGDRKDNEQASFALDKNTEVARRVIDSEAIDLLGDILIALGSSSGTPSQTYSRTVSTPGITQTLLSVTVPVSETLSPKFIRVSGRQPGTYEIKIDSVAVGSGRIGPGRLSDSYVFYINVELTATQVLSVDFTSLAGSPASDVDVTLQALTN